MANLYRVATGNWNATNSWATTSGGTGSVTTPTSADNCYFDANTPVGTVTVNTTASCADLDFTGWTGTFAGTSQLNVYGNAIFVSGMTVSGSSNISFQGGGSKSLTTNGLNLGNKSFLFSSTNIVVTLQDDFTNVIGFTCGNGGTVNPNGKNVTFTGANSINLGVSIGNFNNFSINNSSSKTNSILFLSSIICNGNLTINGNSAINRVLVNSSVKGTSRTITCNGTLTVTNADFQDITGAGTANWDLSSITGGSGDCGGNSGITFTTPINCYYKYITVGGNWSVITRWVTTSGGSTVARVPLPQDTAIIDGNSGVGGVIFQDMPRIGSVDFTGSSGKEWTTSTTCSVFGSINLTDLGTLTASTQAYTFEGRGSNTLTSAGKTWEKPITINCSTGTLSLLDNIIGGVTRIFTQASGIFNVGANNFKFGYFSGLGGTVNMGSGIWELNGDGNNSFNSITLNAETSLLKITAVLTSNKTFNGGGKTFNNFWNASSGSFSINIAGSNTFNDFKTDGGRQTNFTGSTTQTVNTFTSLSSAGNLATIRSTTTTPAVLAKAGGGTISLDYMDVDYITGSPVDTWYMGTHSVDGGHNTNIYFADAPVVLNTSNFFLFF